MNKRLIPALGLAAYSAILTRVMVFKEMPTIRIGHIRMRFAGTDGGHPANFVPFRTIWSYLRGHNGLMIAGVNLVGNIVPLVPIGFLLPFVYRNMTWKASLVLAIAVGVAIEGSQVVLGVGIFDVDDVILNALGVMIGYGAFVSLAQSGLSTSIGSTLGARRAGT
jgi:glycopeptide antibiotics resistance protein